MASRGWWWRPGSDRTSSSDYNMPVMDGLTMLRQMRADESCADFRSHHAHSRGGRDNIAARSRACVRDATSPSPSRTTSCSPRPDVSSA